MERKFTLTREPSTSVRHAVRPLSTGASVSSGAAPGPSAGGTTSISRCPTSSPSIPSRRRADSALGET